MEKDNKEFTAEDIRAITQNGTYEDSSNLWIFLVLMFVFAGWYPPNDSKTREELAELKGKVSVLEKLAARGN